MKKSLTSFCVALVTLACNDTTLAPKSSVPGIQAMSFAHSEWSPPVNLGAPVNSSANEMNAALSSDELALYFISTRAGGLGMADIWVSRRTSVESPWQTPVALGPTINSSGVESAPFVSGDGHLLFFSSDRPGGVGSNDIYVTRRTDKSDDLGWGPAVNLGSDINTPGFDAGGFYLQSSEDGPTNFYFVRGPSNTALDIYTASVRANGETRGAGVPVSELNDVDPATNDGHPSVRRDGREIVFYSNRTGGAGGIDLWMSIRRSVHEPWSTPVNMGAPLNTTANETQPSLSYDARTLIFTSNRLGGLGGNDIWMSTRTSTGKETP